MLQRLAPTGEGSRAKIVMLTVTAGRNTRCNVTLVRADAKNDPRMMRNPVGQFSEPSHHEAQTAKSVRGAAAV